MVTLLPYLSYSYNDQFCVVHYKFQFLFFCYRHYFHECTCFYFFLALLKFQAGIYMTIVFPLDMMLFFTTSPLLVLFLSWATSFIRQLLCSFILWSSHGIPLILDRPALIPEDASGVHPWESLLSMNICF